jgi:hypothetical protein
MKKEYMGILDKAVAQLNNGKRNQVCLEEDDFIMIVNELKNPPAVTSFLGHDLTYWAELEAQAKANYFDPQGLVDQIVKLRGELKGAGIKLTNAGARLESAGRQYVFLSQAKEDSDNRVNELMGEIVNLKKELQDTVNKNSWERATISVQLRNIQDLEKQLDCAVSGYQAITSSQKECIEKLRDSYRRVWEKSCNDTGVIDNLREHLKVANTWKKSAEIYHDKLQQIWTILRKVRRGYDFTIASNALDSIWNVLSQVDPPLKRPE